MRRHRDSPIRIPQIKLLKSGVVLLLENDIEHYSTHKNKVYNDQILQYKMLKNIHEFSHQSKVKGPVRHIMSLGEQFGILRNIFICFLAKLDEKIDIEICLLVKQESIRGSVCDLKLIHHHHCQESTVMLTLM